MHEDNKAHALASWRSLLDSPEIRMTAQEQYEALPGLAETFLSSAFNCAQDSPHIPGGRQAEYSRIVTTELSCAFIAHLDSRCRHALGAGNHEHSRL